MNEQHPILHVNQLWAGIIAEELARSGLRHAVISPGSRSTPMVLALAAHPDITDHSVIDERSAAFYALGLSRATAEPVALLCTSGTAAANYYPAVCEADSARVPLLLLTADRPVHLRDSGAPQTMDQVKLYGDRVRHFAESAQPEAAEEKLRALRAMMSHAVAMTRGRLPGPVHLNLPFRKPLEPAMPEYAADAVDDALIASGSPGMRGRANGRPWTIFTAPAGSAAQEMDRATGIALAADALLRATRPVIIAGPDAGGMDYADALLSFASAQGIPVMAEAASQLRFRDARGAVVVATADLLLRSEGFREYFRPDCILRTGDADTNTGMQRFMESLGDIDVIQLAPDTRRRDPGHAVSQHIEGRVAETLRDIALLLRDGVPAVESGWTHTLQRIDTAVREQLPAALTEAGRGFEGAYVHALEGLLPAGAALFVSSSMPIRDVETFLPSITEQVDMLFNRGVNGIDGIVSTALGSARGRRGRTVLLTGDIAFLHNLNAVYGEGLRELPLTIVLFNNDGGEIFELLPVREAEPAFTRHFLTPQDADFRALADGLHIPIETAGDVEDFTQLLSRALDRPGVSIIEIRTDIRTSGALRRSALRRIAEVADAELADLATQGREAPEGAAAGALSRVFPPAWRMLQPGSGAAAVFLHGFTRSGASWESICTDLDGRRMIAVDLMGHGFSPSPDQRRHPTVYDLQYAADRIEELCARLGIARVHLIGYSMGGRTAMAYAARYPHRLASLALISANPGIEDEAQRRARRDRDDALADRVMGIGLERFAEEWSAQPMFAAQREQDPAAWRHAMRDRMRQRAFGLASSLRGSGQGRQAPLWDALRALSIPVLVTAGEHDGDYSAIAQRMRDILPDATLRVYDGAGHDLLFDRPEQLRRELLELWKRS